MYVAKHILITNMQNSVNITKIAKCCIHFCHNRYLQLSMQHTETINTPIIAETIQSSRDKLEYSVNKRATSTALCYILGSMG